MNYLPVKKTVEGFFLLKNKYELADLTHLLQSKPKLSLLYH